ncbi:bifunctional diaminohydroxyphosphoribosylaminopyrimidine deaminase/5-amino-6-(5-phosphoribosylamino)uracil reductase RibD [Curvibacter sp. HBC61]|uniref:Riboflavin biosynthesis protein RibD n=1 Tax=Curvibacter cyanobacteriorum TaxID=3026422 RepID=A0ABT5MT86_9BURK|nr:bifunctional diaminohydroxyphosphoribosylaminopyrimidine deaminase/5-amino-6-(5-phosphoribosylamino)uracil reductase RibD [Curvibacter sp. HBC61]MDD0837043.1 bifunctional diaminohydroxyphosphoribosylaminopyrimidine deaminase/5-amino-6-(5-phosphoribosylamino)uracil reductase RibD [Curvibacter sp. HBC61]
MTPHALQEALALAHQARLICPPNPAVGAVLVSPDGTVIGRGHTQQRGGPHAEIMALRDAEARGLSPRGATAYVTLEPCSHHGRTGPCCDALIRAGVAKVVASLGDPNPLVSGQGFERLRAAGIEVEVGPGAAEAEALNIGFFTRMRHQRPWVRSKIAGSLDGRTALPNGVSQWITSPEARTDGQAWRARACAVLTGVGTVLADDPQLNVRDVATPRQPHLVVVDSRLRTPTRAKLLGPGREVWIATAVQDPSRHQAWLDLGVQLLVLPDAGGQVDLVALMAELARREVNELHVEAGPTLNGALLEADLIDEWLLYIAPKLLGPGRPLATLTERSALSQTTALHFTDMRAVGPDLRLLARRAEASPASPNDSSTA